MFVFVFQKLKYDLGDCTQWEYMFPSNETPQLLLPPEEGNEGFEEEEVVTSVLLS